MWLTVALLGFTISAIVGILDKFIISKSEVRPIVFTFYSSIFVLPILLLLPFGVAFPSRAIDWLIFVVAGFGFALGLWVMYLGFKKSEISHIGPLVGAATAFFVLILSNLFLPENLGVYKLIAIFVLIIGSLVISFEYSPEHNGLHTGMLLGIISGLLFAISHVASKYAYDVYGFYSGFVWTRSFLGVFGILLLAFPGVRALFYKKKTGAVVKEVKQTVLVCWDKILGVFGLVLIQYAIALGSVTLVNALAGVQFAILIIFVALLSKFFPKIFKEEYMGREIIQEFFAVVLIAGGLALMLIK
ncbi:MAG: DMT family transporter [Patescibacteria group bacterium]